MKTDRSVKCHDLEDPREPDLQVGLLSKIWTETLIAPRTKDDKIASVAGEVLTADAVIRYDIFINMFKKNS